MSTNQDKVAVIGITDEAIETTAGVVRWAVATAAARQPDPELRIAYRLLVSEASKLMAAVYTHRISPKNSEDGKEYWTVSGMTHEGKSVYFGHDKALRSYDEAVAYLREIGVGEPRNRPVE